MTEKIVPGQIGSQNPKLFVLSEIGFILILLEYLEFKDDVQIFYFRPKILFLGEFDLKCQNCLCKMKLGTQSNSNMQNAMVMFTLFLRIVVGDYYRDLICAALAAQHTSEPSVPYSQGGWEHAVRASNGLRGEAPQKFLR